MRKIAPYILFVRRLVRTIRYLKTRQIIYQVWYRARIRSMPSAPKFKISEPKTRHPFLGSADAWIPGNSFTFLNETREYNELIPWDDKNAEKLWLYNLHYFDYLLSKNSDEYVAYCGNAISDWTARNTDIKKDAWEPYPTSLRIVNWIKFESRYRCLSDSALSSLASQAKWLAKSLEYHILANHLFANAKALVFAGLFFEGKEPAAWLRKGEELITTELQEQVLSDGGHFERSPMYHAIILEDLLDLINISESKKHLIPESSMRIWIDTAQRMLGWLQNMVHPDGRIPFFNDAAFGIAPEFDQLEQYANKLGLDAVNSDDSKTRQINKLRSRTLSDSGFVILSRGSFNVICNTASIGPSYQPGHAHADTLSCEISVGAERVFVNSGTSTYKKGPIRDWQRSTLAHNTVEVGGENSSDVWGGFRVAKRSNVFGIGLNSEEHIDILTGSHDGYRNIRNSTVHKRTWALTANELIVTDDIIKSDKGLKCNWLLHPSVQLLDKNQLCTAQGVVLNWSIEGGVVGIEDAYWYPEFGVEQATKRIAIHLPNRINSMIPQSLNLKLSLSDSQ